MNEEYKEMIRENFLKFIKKEEVENNNKIIGAMYFAWLEATRQADERSKTYDGFLQWIDPSDE